MKYLLQLSGEFSDQGFIVSAKDAASMVQILERSPTVNKNYNSEKHHMEYIMRTERLPHLTGISLEHVIFPSANICEAISLVRTYPDFVKEVQEIKQEIEEAERQEIEKAQKIQEAASATVATTNDIPF